MKTRKARQRAKPARQQATPTLTLLASAKRSRVKRWRAEPARGKPLAQLLTTRELAERLGLSVQTVLRRARAGMLPFIDLRKPGGEYPVYRFNESVLMGLLQPDRSRPDLDELRFRELCIEEVARARARQAARKAERKAVRRTWVNGVAHKTAAGYRPRGERLKKESIRFDGPAGINKFFTHTAARLPWPMVAVWCYLWRHAHGVGDGTLTGWNQMIKDLGPQRHATIRRRVTALARDGLLTFSCRKQGRDRFTYMLFYRNWRT